MHNLGGVIAIVSMVLRRDGGGFDGELAEEYLIAHIKANGSGYFTTPPLMIKTRALHALVL